MRQGTILFAEAARPSLQWRTVTSTQMPCHFAMMRATPLSSQALAKTTLKRRYSCFDRGEGDPSKCTFSKPLQQWMLPAFRQRQRHQAYLQMEHIRAADSILWVRSPRKVSPMYTSPSVGIFQETRQAGQCLNLLLSAFPITSEFIGIAEWQTSMEIILPLLKECPLRSIRILAYSSSGKLTPPCMKFLIDPFTAREILSHGIRAVSDGSVCPENQNSF